MFFKKHSEMQMAHTIHIKITQQDVSHCKFIMSKRNLDGLTLQSRAEGKMWSVDVTDRVSLG